MGVDRVFVARLVGLAVFGPDGERIGKVRDLVVGLRVDANPPRVLGMVVELATRRRIFVPMLRVTAVDPSAVTLATGSVSLRGFTQRPNETLVVGQLLDARVRLVDSGAEMVVMDAAIEPTRSRDWVIGRLAVRPPRRGLTRRGQIQIVPWRSVTGLSLTDRQGTEGLLSVFETMRPADVAAALHELPEKRRFEVIDALDDERLADVFEEMSDRPSAVLLSPPGRGAGRRRAGGHVPGRRRGPARRPAGRRVGSAAGADGAGGVGPGAPAAELLGAHRGRADDPGADHPAAGRHGGRGAGPGPQPGHPARAGQHGVRLPAAVGDPDRALPRLRARSSGCSGRHRSSWSPAWWTPSCRGWRRRPRWAR